MTSFVARILSLFLGVSLMLGSASLHAQRPIHSSADVAGSLFVTEICRSGTNSGFADMVEIVNASPYTWNLTNVFVSDVVPDGADTNGDTFRFPNGASIQPYAAAILFFDRDVTQIMIDTVPTTSTTARGGVKVYVPENTANGPVTGLTFNGQPVGVLLENGGDVSGGTIGGADTIVMGWKSTLPANAPGSASFTISAGDVIDGISWSESGNSPGTFTWGPGVTNTTFLDTTAGTNVDSFKRKADASGTRPLDTNAAGDWVIDAVTDLNIGSAAWAPKALNTPADASGLLVTEVNRSGSTNSTFSAEFIEIVNNSENDYLLNNLFATDNSTSGTDKNEGSEAFPPNDVFPAKSTLVLISDAAAPTTTTFANIPTTHSLSPGGILVYGADPVMLTSTTVYKFGGVPVRSARSHSLISFSNAGDNVSIGVKTLPAPPTTFATAGADLVDGMGYREGNDVFGGDWIGWALNNTTTDPTLAVDSGSGTTTRVDTYKRTSLTDTNTKADWSISTVSSSTPGVPPALLTGVSALPNAAKYWIYFE